MRWLGPAFVRAVARGELGLAVTGAGSWLGQAFLALLDDAGAITPATRVRLFASTSRAIEVGGDVLPAERLAGAPALRGGAWLLLHFAFLGKERVADLAVPDFVSANDAILAETLRIAESADELRFVFTSSGAVYGHGRQLVGDAAESPYGWCKVAHEERIAEWCANRSAPLVMPRVFNVGGPFVNKVESYALSSFIASARRDGVIRINARRRTWRSYVHVNELLACLCDAALFQAAGRPLVFDTVGETTPEMADLAETVRDVLMPLPVSIERPPLEAGEDRYVGEGDGYARLLERQGRTRAPLATIVRDTDTYLSSARSSGIAPR